MSGLYGDDKATQISVTLILSILVVTDIIGNTFVILIILTNKSMRSPMNHLLLNLAVADMMVGIFFSPLYIFSHFFPHPDGLAGTLLCKLLTGGGLAWIGGACSAATLIAISFERYFAVMHPYGTKYKLSIKRAKQVVAGCWVFGVVTVIPTFVALDYDKDAYPCVQKWSEPLFGRAYSTLCFFCFGVFPIAIMFVLYSRVIYTLWFRKQNQVQGTQLAMLKSRKRVTKMVVIVSVVYAVCWLPDLLIYLLYHQEGIIENDYLVDVPSICGIVLVTCNSSINPFIYTFQSNVFRRHLIELVCCRKFRKNAVQVDNERETRPNETGHKNVFHLFNGGDSSVNTVMTHSKSGLTHKTTDIPCESSVDQTMH